ncbi:MAG TPA: peptidoglycan-binding domain-containing protein [Bryobacteraceae bacterium]|nr:peptidoglycan-binding domain-containing protein [Bryobacteraceae bacterium]
MHKIVLSALAIGILACSAGAATPTASKKKHHAATPTKPSATHTRKHTATSATSATAKRKGKKSRTSARSYQQAPTAERYKEIQEALARKGFYQGEANGAWSTDSADALKRFQTSQNLAADGKINSLSLIALGLGPNHLSASAKPASQPATPSAAPQQ